MNTVLITGTTNGLGKLLVEKFAQDGYNLVLVSRSEEKLLKQKEQLKNNNVHIISYDLSKEDACDYIIDNLNENQIKIDVLVNNVGFDYADKFIDTPFEEIDQMMTTMIDLTVKLTYSLLVHMLEQNKGKIVNVSSVAGRIPLPNNVIYSACKSFVYMFSNALDIELKNTNVSVSVICPGPTKTNFANRANLNNSLLFKFNTKKPEPVINHAYKKINKGSRNITYGFINNIQIYFYNVLPKKLFDGLIIMLTKISK
ncbi:MAG: SDR family oxidoreductase [Erysipelotrichaceae bacterium]|nr:SDR family oxidoreductase [Erysipelotrichaceae bacterium]